MSRLPVRFLLRFRVALAGVACLVPTAPAAAASQPFRALEELPPAALVAQGGPCEQRVAFGLVEATTAGCLTSVAPGRWESTSPVTVNGLPLAVAPGTKLELSAPTDDAPGGRLAVTASIDVAGVTVHAGELRVDLPAGGRGDEQDVKTFVPADGQTLFGFGVSGTAALRFGYGADGRHYSLFRVVVALPDIFRSGPGPQAGGLTTTVGVRVDDLGVHADAVKVQVANAYVGQILIKDLCLSYTAAGTTTTTPCAPPAFGAQPLLTCSSGTDVSRWDGAALVVLPTESATEVGVFAGARDGEFSYAGAQVRNLGTAVPLASGVYLDSVALAICVNPPPLRFKGAAGIRFGPNFSGRQAALLEGEVEFVDSRPWVFSARGALTLFDRRVANGFLIYRSSGSVDFGFAAGFDFGIASVNAEVSGWLETVQPVRFTVDGRGSVCVASVACVTGEVTASTVGLAGCFTLSDFTYWVLEKDGDWVWWAPWRVHWESRTLRVRGGLGYRWGGSGPDVMGGSCDVAPYRAVRSAVVSAAGERTLRLPDEPVVALRIEGTTRPPKVSVTGPGGRRIASPAAAGVIDQGSHVIAEDPQARTTQVLIAHPRPGRWTIAPQPGSAPIADVQRAGTRERPTVVADVGGAGSRRVLAYAYDAQRQEITFVERSDDRSETKVIGNAAGKPCRGESDGPEDRRRPLCGRIRFTPGDGPPGKRSIYAVLSDDGVAFDETLVATYDATGGRPPRPRALLLQRHGRRVVATWRQAPGVQRYDVRASVRNGPHVLIAHSGPVGRAVIRHIGAHRRVRVTVVAVDEGLRQSRPARARLRAGQQRARGGSQ